MSIFHLPEVAKSLEDIGSVTYVTNASLDNILHLAKNNKYEILYVAPNRMRFVLSGELIDLLGAKIIATVSTGTNHIDMDYCQNNDISVIDLSTDYECINNISSTAEHAFALMLSLLRRIPVSFQSVQKGLWDYIPFMGNQLSCLTAGIIGYGRLGKMFASYCEAFNMRVLIYDCRPVASSQCDSIEDVFQQSDIVSLHVPLNEETYHMIDYEILKRSQVYLINTSRGDIVDEKDVIRSLRAGHLLGYATDVLSDELGDISVSPIVKESFRQNIIITPHVGGATYEAQRLSCMRIVDRLKREVEN